MAARRATFAACRITLAVLSLSLHLVGVQAATVSDPASDPASNSASDMPSCLRESLPQARIAGEGSYRWFGIHVYDARLWIGPAGLRIDTLWNAPFALELRYARDLGGGKIAEASLREIEKVAAPDATQRRDWLARMQSLFPDVHSDTRLTGIYRPNGATAFCLDGRRIGDVADPAFGRAFFSIWLSPRTSAPDLRAALLRDAGPPP